MEEKSLQSHELLQVVDMIANERAIEHEEVFMAMEQAILRIARTTYGQELNLDVQLDRRTGEYSISRLQHVVEKVEDSLTEISLEDAQAQDSSVAAGDYLAEELPRVPFGRMAAQIARQVIVQRVREAERTRQYEEFKDRVGEVITGIVKRIEFGHAILDLGRAEAILRKEQMIPREPIRSGDRVRVLITELRPEAKGPLIIASRTHPHFMAKLFEHEVPEIYEGIVQIRSVSRDPGSRGKIAVSTDDPSLDPVGSCVGMRGARVQAVTNELQGEKIDVVLWSSNIATFMVNALAPAEVLRVVVDEDAQKLRVVVADDQLSLAIGRRGQNVRLASQLTGWNVDIVTETDDANQRAADMNDKCNLFKEALGVDDMLAQLLYTEGFDTVEDIALIPLEEFASIEGMDEDLVKTLQGRAKDYLDQKRAAFEKQCIENGVEKELIEISCLKPSDIESFVKANLKTRDDIAELDGFEVVSLLGQAHCSLDRANQIVMAVRSHWFDENDAGKKE